MSGTPQREGRRPSGSKPISDYALIGDLQTAALVAMDGSIDWLCLPRFDSGACFAALLDDDSSGHWTVAPSSGGQATSRNYDDHTLILRSRWDTSEGSVDVVDFMPPRGEAADVVRVVQGVSGQVTMESTLRLRFNYGRVNPWVRLGDRDTHASRVVSATAGPSSVWVQSDVPLTHD
jgi:GH15 family glucan-1,4-alpha-glucosidase